jgi:hypothetical protein
VKQKTKELKKIVTQLRREMVIRQKAIIVRDFSEIAQGYKTPALGTINPNVA